jgi:hypothetical protein
VAEDEGSRRNDGGRSKEPGGEGLKEGARSLPPLALSPNSSSSLADDSRFAPAAAPSSPRTRHDGESTSKSASNDQKLASATEDSAFESAAVGAAAPERAAWASRLAERGAG